MNKTIQKIFDEKQGYEVTEKGTLINKKTGNETKGSVESGGYLLFTIKGKNYRAHRVIAMHFIPNPENKPQVNHIDGNKKNNDVSNLEWVTESENTKHAHDLKLKTAKSKKIFVYKKETKELIGVFDGYKKASDATGIHIQTIAAQVRRNNIRYTKGELIFLEKELKCIQNKIKKHHKSKETFVFDKEGKLIKSFSSLKEATEEMCKEDYILAKNNAANDTFYPNKSKTKYIYSYNKEIVIKRQ